MYILFVVKVFTVEVRQSFYHYNLVIRQSIFVSTVTNCIKDDRVNPSVLIL